MSYDLEARHDDTYSVKMSRSRIHGIIGAVPHAKANGETGFIIERDKTLYMEVDVEFVSEEGDNLEEDGVHSEVNCIRFCIPAAFEGRVPECVQIAADISSAVGWPLIDGQTGELAQVQPQKPSLPEQSKPWWKFW